jgi:hypothetical protein
VRIQQILIPKEILDLLGQGMVEVVGDDKLSLVRSQFESRAGRLDGHQFRYRFACLDDDDFLANSNTLQ